MSDKKLVMCGCHVAGVPIVEALLNAGHRFASFVLLTPEQATKYSVSGYYDYRPIAHQHEIPVYTPQEYSLRNKTDMDFFSSNQFDLLIQGGWQRLFPKEILNTLGIGAVGGHGSADFLPKGRGRSPLNWALVNGKPRFIMHLFLIKPGADDGDVFDWEMFDINVFDNIKTLYFKNSMVSTRMLLRSLPKLLDGSITLKPQRGEPSYYPKRTPEDGTVDWEVMDVWEVYNLIRALSKPYPGARASINGCDYYLWEAQVFDEQITFPDFEYGDIVQRFGEEIVVNCLGGLLLVKQFERI